MKTCYSVLFFFALLGVSLCRLDEKVLHATDRECIQELGLDIETILNGVGDDLLTREDDPVMAEFSLCCLKKYNAVDEDNKVKYDFMKTNLMPAYLDTIRPGLENKEQITADGIENCKTIEGTDAGNTVVKFNNCIIKYLKNL